MSFPSSPSEVIYQLLLDVHEDESGGWPIFISFVPDTPDKSIGVFDTAGKLDGRIMSTGEQIEHPGIQIQVRGSDYEEAWKKANALAINLDSVNKISVATSSTEIYIVHNVSRTGAVIPAGVEEIDTRRRYLFTLNMTITISIEP